MRCRAARSHRGALRPSWLKTRCELSADAIFAEALHDKKRAGDTIDLVIPHGIGRCSIDRTPLSTFHDLIAEGLGQKGDASRMLARITPSPLSTVPAIASKSMAHRLIICAALANGETHVTCNTTCADIEATVRCLTALSIDRCTAYVRLSIIDVHYVRLASIDVQLLRLTSSCTATYV